MRYNTAAQKFVSAVSSAFILFNSIAPYALVLTSQPLPVANVIAQEVTEPTAEPTQESQVTPVEESPTSEPTAEPSVEPTSEPTVEPTQEITSSPSENTSNPSEQTSQPSEPTSSSVATPTVEVVPTVSDENAHVESTVVESNQCYADSLNGCNASVVTDKEDYAPTEMVLLKGSGFSPHTMYRMVISSSDAPAVTFETYITTDELGEFSASYQLDGMYRPNYEVNIYNEANELVARKTFTDSDTNYKSPTASTTVINVTNPNNAFSSDNSYAVFDANNDQVDYVNFTFGIPAGSTIDGIEVRTEGNRTGNRDLHISLSWNGLNFTAEDPVAFSGTDSQIVLGGATDTWGRAWSYNDFSDGNFRLRARTSGGNNLVNLDHVQIKVFFTEPGATPTVTPTSVPTATPTAGPTGAPVGGQTVQNSCIDELVDGPINCTANDVSIANVTNIEVLDDGCTSPSDTVTFRADWQVQSTATQRYNVGLWFATGGQSSALSGSCSISTLPYSPVPPWYNFDSNVCGDISSAAPVNPSLTLTVACIPDANNYLNLPYCTTWEQNATACTGPLDTVPGAPSKCNCEDGFSVPITVPEFAKIEVVKDLVPSNDSGTFNLQVNSTTEAACVSDAGTTGIVNVTAGTNANPGATHTVGETACAGTTISNYSSTITCVDRGTTNVVATSSGTGPLNVDVDPDDDIVCTITNTVNQGQLKVVKNTSGDNGTFDFSVSGPSASTPQITTVGNTGTTGFVSVNTGTYAVSETVPTGWSLTSASCTNAAGAPIGTSGSTGVTGITVGPNDQITCTFNNTRLRDITACKYEDENGDGNRTGDTLLGDWTMTLTPGNVVQVTDQNGCTTFNDLLPGQYTVTETQKTDWSNTTPLFQNVELTSSSDQTVYFGNFACATVSGSKWEDLNGNGEWDQDEPTVADWPINLSGQSEDQTTTDENGNYSFKVCTPGIHVVAEGTLDANTWYQTYPAYKYYDVTVESGNSYTDNDFGNAKYAQIYGYKYQDNDGDGQLDADDLLDTLGGWVFELYDGVTSALLNTYTTLSDGFFEFTGLLAGNTYYVKEQQQAGWTQTYGPQSLTPTPIGMVSGAETQVDFANFENIDITGTKYNDLNGNGSRDQEPGLQGWTIFIDTNDNQTLDQGEVSDTTDANGNYSFTNLGPGTYVVCEVAQSGWTQTSSPTCHTVVAESGQNSQGNDFGNQGRGTLIIKKVLNPTNDTSLWDMAVDGEYATASSTLGHNQTSQHILPDGEYDIVESPDTGVNGDLYDSTYSCTNQQAGNGRIIDDLSVNTGETVTCTFTNVARGSITIIKDANPNSAQDFAFTATGTGSFSLDDDADNTLSNSITIPSLVNGVYTFTEAAVDGWDLTGLTCSDGQSSVPSTVSLENRVATINLEPGENVTCTFTNTQRGSISGYKFEDADGDIASTDDLSAVLGWNIDLYSCLSGYVDCTKIDSATTDASGFYSFSNLVPDLYKVMEELVAGWTHLTTDELNVELVAGESDANNNFTNFKNVSVTVCKVIDRDGNTTTTNDQTPYTGWPVMLLEDGEVIDTQETGARTGCYTWSNLGPGHTYGVEEGTVNGYDAIGDTTHSFGLAQSGSQYSHTFYNQGRGTLIVQKMLNPTDDASLWDIDVTGDGVDEETTLGHNQSQEFDLPAGEYAVVENPDETVVEDIYDSSYACSNQQSGNGRNIDDITLSPGETVTCTFTNVARGTITVTKDVVPNDSTFWDFALKAGQQTVGSTSLADTESHTFTDLVNGEYVLSEETSELYATDIDCGVEGTASNQGSINFNLDPGESINCTYTNTRNTGKLIINKLLDEDGNLQTTDDRTDGVEWEFNVDGQSSDTPDLGPLSTDVNGEVTVDPLNTGTYNVGEVVEEGYKLLSAECTTGSQDGEIVYGVEVATDETATCTFINTRERGTVNVTKYHDVNADGTRDEGEEVLADWTINLDEDSELTGEDGEVTFNPVTGEYELSEDLPEGWIQSNIACSLDEEGIGSYNEENDSLSLTVGADQVIDCEIGNYQDGEIIVTKYSDDNGNGVWDKGEEAMGGWEMNLAQGESLKEQTTGEENGQTTFDDLTPGTYVLSEDQQKGWEQTAITCNVEETNPTVTPTVTGEPTATPTPGIFTGGLCHWNEGADKWNALAVEIDNPGHVGHELDFPYEGPREDNGHPDSQTGDDWCEENDPNQNFETQGLIDRVQAAEVDAIDEQIDTETVEVTSGQTVNCEVGNKPLIPELTIAKKNDTGGAPRVPGDIVTFTLTVTVAESSVEDTLVIDVPSEGFQYVGGSWTALKNGLPFIIPEPTYASPGTWSLGDLQIGDEIVLTYQAKVAATQDTGVYPDLAWSEGQSLGGEQVLALAQPEGFVDTNFVGTEVEILADNYINDSLDIRREEKREEGKVLGASTLPATGAATILALAALLMVAAGAGGVAYGLRLKKKKS